MQTRARSETRVYANGESVHAQADASRDLRTATVDAYSEALARPTEKATTLDYATPEAKAKLAARMTPMCSAVLGSTGRRRSGSGPTSTGSGWCCPRGRPGWWPAD